MSGRTRRGRPYALPPLRFPAETLDGRTVYITTKRIEGDQTVLVDEDGGEWIAERLKLVPREASP